jgi:hypothetical protein
MVVSRRIRTNTPLQALVTLNDPVFVEASQALARVMANADTALDEQIKTGYRRAMATDPSPATLARLRQLYDTSASDYRKRPALLHNALSPYIPYDTAGMSPATTYQEMKGQRTPDSLKTPAWAARPVHDPVRVAALTAVAGVILNLDAFLTKQ